MEAGWVKISRDITRHWVWDRPLYLKWWLDLVMMAAWTEEKRLINGRICTIGRGQIAASVEFLRERWEYRHEGGRCQGKITRPARKTVGKFMGFLQSEGMILRDLTALPNHTPLITICNYDKYQPNLDVLETTNNTTSAPTSVTAAGTPTAPTSEPTSGTTSAPTSGTTSAPQLKNIRIKNINNTLSLKGESEENSNFSMKGDPLWPEVLEYFKEIDKQVPIAKKEECAKYFFDHFNALGWVGTNGRKITNWRSRAQIWAQDWNNREQNRKNGNNEKRKAGGDSRRGVDAVARTAEEWKETF